MRSFLLKLHYYLAFIFLLPLIIAGATGMVIAYDHAIEEKLYPELMQHGGEPLADRLAIDYDRAIAAAAPLQTDEQAITSVNAPRTEDTNILVTLGGKGNQREVYINPYTYELAGERGRDDSFMRTVYKLHATLLVRPAGDYVLLLSAVSLGLLSIGGIVN